MANRLVPADTETGKLPDVVLDDLSSRYAPIGGSAVARQRYDAAGEALAAKLDIGAGGDAVMCLLGDSTGNDGNEWFKLWTNEIAASHPSLRVEYALWSDANQAYPTMTVVQAGTDYVPAGPRTIVADDFNRTASDLAGSNPTTGAAWTGTAGVFSVNGTRAVAGTTLGDAVSSGGATGDGTVTAGSVQLDTTAGSTAKQLRIYTKYVSSANHVYVFINVSNTGVVTWGIFKRIGGTATSIASGTALGLTANQVNTFNMAITVSGLSVSATVNGVTATGTLLQSDADALAGATSAGIGLSGGVATAGTSIDSFTYSVTASPSGQKLTVYNGSMPGSTLAYQSTRLAAMVPVRPDLVFLSSGHNYTSGLPGPYVAALTQFVADLRTLHSGVPVTYSSQNPEFAPWPNVKAHLDRLVQGRILALQNGWGYLPVVESFRAKTDGGQSLVMTDGIHPTAEGSILWRQVASAYLAAKSLTPA
jgi:lysophospholipase L1-like esterase